MKIGIIGMGVAGISILRELHRQLKETDSKKFSVIIFTEASQFGTGFPYQADDESLLINQYTETMTIDPEKPDDFVDWIAENKSSQSIYHTHLPRTWFGEYLNERMNEWLGKLNVKIIYEKAIDIEHLANGHYAVHTANSTTSVECIHLTTGHLAYKDPYDLKGEKGYVYSPYPAKEKIQLNTPKSSVAIIGTGLTALDAMLYVNKEYPFADLTFYSRDGLFSSVRGNETSVDMHYFCQDKVIELLNKGQIMTLELVKDWFYREMTEHGINVEWVWENLGNGTIEGMAMDLSHSDSLGEFQSLIRHMRNCYPVIWNTLPDDEKNLFLQTYGKQWQRFKAPIPQKTAQYIIRKVKQNEISIVSGLDTIRKAGDQFILKTAGDQLFTADHVINCTGQVIDLTQSLSKQDPLIRQLVSRKLVSPSAYGGIAIDYPSMSIVDADNKRHPLFKAYGQIVSGVQFGNNNVELITLSAISGVQSMRDALKKTPTNQTNET